MSKLTEESAKALTDAIRVGTEDLSAHLTRLEYLRGKLIALEALLIEMDNALRGGFAKHKQAHVVLGDLIDQAKIKEQEFEMAQSLINSWES